MYLNPFPKSKSLDFSNLTPPPPPKKKKFYVSAVTSLLKTLWEKEKLLVTSNFSFFHYFFYQFEELTSIFIKFEIVVYKLFQSPRRV